MLRFLPAVLAILLCAMPAFADDDQTDQSSQTFDHPDLLSLGGAYTDFDKTGRHRQSADFRLEYRFGIAAQVSDTVGFHPFLGYQTNTRNMQYGLGGFAMDWNFSRHGILTWSEGAGYLDSGNMVSMGGTLQFRSMLEVGYRFDNDMRLTAEASHISDGNITRVNPGQETVGMYLHVPVRMIVGAVTGQ